MHPGKAVAGARMFSPSGDLPPGFTLAITLLIQATAAATTIAPAVAAPRLIDMRHWAQPLRACLRGRFQLLALVLAAVCDGMSCPA
jgi:hypothetical protein